MMSSIVETRSIQFQRVQVEFQKVSNRKNKRQRSVNESDATRRLKHTVSSLSIDDDPPE